MRKMGKTQLLSKGLIQPFAQNGLQAKDKIVTRESVASGFKESFGATSILDWELFFVGRGIYVARPFSF